MKKQSAVYRPEDSLEAIGLGFIPGTIAINIQRLWSKMGLVKKHSTKYDCYQHSQCQLALVQEIVNTHTYTKKQQYLMIQ